MYPWAHPHSTTPFLALKTYQWHPIVNKQDRDQDLSMAVHGLSLPTRLSRFISRLFSFSLCVPVTYNLICSSSNILQIFKNPSSFRDTFTGTGHHPKQLTSNSYSSFKPQSKCPQTQTSPLVRHSHSILYLLFITLTTFYIIRACIWLFDSFTQL